jgi:hypothetical protein
MGAPKVMADRNPQNQSRENLNRAGGTMNVRLKRLNGQAIVAADVGKEEDVKRKKT